MKIALLVLTLLLSSCSGVQTRFDSFPSVICEQMIGRDWTTLAAPPGNSGELLGLLGRRDFSGMGTLWFSGKDESTAVCFYGSDVCGSEAHVFRRSASGWTVDDSEVTEFICTA